MLSLETKFIVEHNDKQQDRDERRVSDTSSLPNFSSGTNMAMIRPMKNGARIHRLVKMAHQA